MYSIGLNHNKPLPKNYYASIRGYDETYWLWRILRYKGLCSLANGHLDSAHVGHACCFSTAPSLGTETVIFLVT